MSLFLQTLVLRGILFREQEHRLERIGVGMTLWPTGPTKVEEANEIEIGNFIAALGTGQVNPGVSRVEIYHNRRRKND